MNHRLNPIFTMLPPVIQRGRQGLETLGQWLGLLSLRLLLAWDFFESGLEKFHGDNWFQEIQDQFPFPFNLISPDLSWSLATGFELLGGIALLVGLGTRFFALSLWILTWVAIVAVHWPEHWQTWGELMQGYGFTDRGFGNFKLPVIFMGMLWPLILLGPGKLSLDYGLGVLYRRARSPASTEHHP